ncbi:MAG: hypothetical protein HKN66_07510 [Flavobacteriaceae bacterium]|nr:hypothetical protein [Flavobacteriaceae bacterium]
MKRAKFSLIILIVILLASCNESKKNPQYIEEKVTDYAIVYNVLVNDSTDNYDVFSMNIDGSDKTNITKLPGLEWTYFSDNERVLFVSDKDTCQRCYSLYETNYKGENSKKISDIRLADSWMSSRKNSTELIVRPHSKVDSLFYIIDRKGNILS